MTKPIVPSLTPSPPAHAPTDPDAPRPCVACGGPRHGSVGAERLCLEREIVRLRAALSRHQVGK